MFSRRTDHEREPNAIVVALERARSAGLVRADLTGSNPTELGLGLDADTLLAAYEGLAIDRYDPDPRGSIASRRAFGRLLGVDPARVLLTASTSEAYAFVLAVLADPGDRILVPRPSYPLLEWLARLSGATLVPYDLAYDGEWFLDRAAFDREAARDAKAILVVSPNNPTGSYLREDERAFLLELGIPLVVDEVFAEFPLDRAEPLRLPAVDRGLVFRLTGLSKLAALPQMKLGCVAVEGEPRLVDEAYARLELVADTFLSVSTPTDLAAPRWIEASASVRERIRSRCRANLDALDRAIEHTAIGRLRAEAGWSAIVRVPALASERDCVLALLERGVVVQPGWYYDLVGGTHLVVSLLTDEATFAAGIAELVAWVERGAPITDPSAR